MKQFTLLILLICPYWLLAQTSENKTIAFLKSEIEMLIRETISEEDIPALSAGIIYRGDTLFLKGYGTLKRGESTQADKHTLYQIASISKMLTGIIAKNLYEEKVLDLYASITNYLPKDLPAKTLKKLSPIRPVDLLLHRSGLPRNSKVVKRKDGEPMLVGYTEQDLLLDLNKLKLKTKPDQKYSYSNVGFAILGYLLEKASGLSYEDLLRKYVGQKYGLKNTTIALNEEEKGKMAIPYRKESRRKETKPWLSGKLVVASGLYSSVEDLSILQLEQLKAYKAYLNHKTSNPLILTEIRGERGPNSYYGMGLYEDVFERGMLYGHRGDMDGFAGVYSFNLKTETGVVLLTSSGGDWLGLLAGRINKLLEEASLAEQKN